MAQFAYKARRRSGEVVTGVLDVADRSAALMQIERLGLFPVLIDASKASVAAAAENRSAAPGKSLMPAAFAAGLRRRRKPKLQELATFTNSSPICLSAACRSQSLSIA